MAEGRYRSFAPLSKLPANWPDAVAAFVAPISNLNLAPKSSTTVMAPVDTQTQLSLGVDGLWRYSEVEIDAAVPAGAAQTFDIVATTTANSFKAPSKEGEGETDETNYAFALQVVTHGTLPSGGGIAAAQKVGEVDWDGAQITGIRQLVGTLRATDPLSPAMPLVSVPAINAAGIAHSTAPLVRLAAPEAANQVLEVLQGAASKLKVNASGQIEWTGGPTLHAEGSSLVLTGKLSVSEVATLAAGSTVPTPGEGDNTTKIATTAFVKTAVAAGDATEKARAEAAEALLAPLASPALTGVPKAPTAAALTNSTQIATTAYADAAVGIEKTRAEAAEALKAPLASPAFTGNPTAPTQAEGNNSTRLATTAFVQDRYSSGSSWTALAAYVSGEEKEVSPSRYGRVLLQLKIANGKLATATITVGGTALPKLEIEPAAGGGGGNGASVPYGFDVPPGQKWKATLANVADAKYQTLVV